ncbi:MAG: HEAT repeat domain-containing protein [Alphaproteobacteria bacterium]
MPAARVLFCRCLAPAVAWLGVTAIAFAQSAPADPAAVFAEARAICGEDAQSALCRALQEQIADHAAQSLLVVGASGQRAAAVEAVRDFADWPQPMVRYAAATALGGLHPAAEDTLVLARLLNDPVPAVRAAARSSLNVSSDPAARRLVERSLERQGIAMVPDGPLVDPAALPVALPAGLEPVRFTDDAEDGVAAFVTDASPETVLAEFAAKLGEQPLGLDALAALYGAPADAPTLDVNDPMAVMQFMIELQERVADLPEDQQQAAYLAAMQELAGASGELEQDTAPLDRWRDTRLYGDPMTVLLPADPAVPSPFPTRIAVVYHDVTLDRTGFALQWIPPAAMPPRPEPAAVDQVQAPAAGIFGLQSTPADRIRPTAAEVEALVWDAVRLSEDPAAAQLYLDAYPDGPHVGEAVALGDALQQGQAAVGDDAPPSSLFGRPVEAPALAVDAATVLANERIVVRYSGLPGSRSQWIAIAPAGSADSAWGNWAYADEPAEGVVTLPHQAPGDYELRAYLESPREVIARLPITVVPIDPDAVTVPTLEADATTFAVGEQIGIRWSGLPGSRNDWITVVPVGTPDSTWGDWAYTGNTPSGRLVLPGQDAPGNYEIRAYLEWPREVVARIPLTVTAPE